MLIYFAWKGDAGKVEQLMGLTERPSTISTAVNKYSFTALMCAALSGNVEIVKRLCDLVNLEVTSNKGWTALHFAILGGSLQCVEALLDAGAKVNHPTGTGTTAFMMATKYGNMKMMLLLLREGADVHARTRNGNSASTIARNQLREVREGKELGRGILPIANLLWITGLDDYNFFEGLH